MGNLKWWYAVSPCRGGDCSSQDEEGLAAAVSTYGPMTICLNANWDNHIGWHYHGVYTGLNGQCSSSIQHVDHCVQLVATTKHHLLHTGRFATHGAPTGVTMGTSKFHMGQTTAASQMRRISSRWRVAWARRPRSQFVQAPLIWSSYDAPVSGTGFQFHIRGMWWWLWRRTQRKGAF